MKVYWSDMLYELREGNYSEEYFAKEASEDICNDLDNVEKAIKDLDLQGALALINKAQDIY